MKMKSEFKKISIIGLGLIGTSILRAINAKQNEGVKTFAYDVNSKHRDIVSEMKIATFVCDEIHGAVKDADLIILAVPVGSMKILATAIGPSLKKDAIVTDTGSTKSSVINDVNPFIPKNIDDVIEIDKIARNVSIHFEVPRVGKCGAAACARMRAGAGNAGCGQF